MAQVKMLLDSFDTSTIGVTVEDAPERRAMLEATYVTGSNAGRPDHRLLALEPEHSRRNFPVTVLLEGATTTEFYSRRDNLASRLDRRSDVELSFSDITGRHFLAKVEQGVPDDFIQAQTRLARFQLLFLILNPFLLEDTESSVTGITTATDILTGNALSTLFRLRINGAFTDPTLIAKDPSGNTLFNTSFDLSKGAGEWIELDMGKGTIVDDVGANQMSARTLGTDFPWFLDPKDFSFHTSSWPTVEVSSGTADVFLTKAYR